MPRPDFPGSIIEFQQRFSSEEACLEYLIASRWPEGFVCPRCSSREAYWKAPRELFECKVCGYQASVTAGTIMHRTKIPLPVWFWGAYLVTTHTPGMSALQFQRQAGLSRYETAFQMFHKLRAAMVKERREKLVGMVEMDESYIGGRKAGPGGRGARGKAIVVGAIEVRGEHTGRIRLRSIPNVSAKTLTKFAAAAVEPGTVVRTDGWKGYSELSSCGYSHDPVVEGEPEEGSVILPHIHRIISNLKTWLIGTHHGVSKHHLQAYLNEFTFRFNRRKTPMAAFQTVLGLIDERIGPTYEQIYGVEERESGAWEHPNLSGLWESTG